MREIDIFNNFYGLYKWDGWDEKLLFHATAGAAAADTRFSRNCCLHFFLQSSEILDVSTNPFGVLPSFFRDRWKQLAFLFVLFFCSFLSYGRDMDTLARKNYGSE